MKEGRYHLLNLVNFRKFSRSRRYSLLRTHSDAAEDALLGKFEIYGSTLVLQQLTCFYTQIASKFFVDSCIKCLKSMQHEVEQTPWSRVC